MLRPDITPVHKRTRASQIPRRHPDACTLWKAALCARKRCGKASTNASFCFLFHVRAIDLQHTCTKVRSNASATYRRNTSSPLVLRQRGALVITRKIRNQYIEHSAIQESAKTRRNSYTETGVLNSSSICNHSETRTLRDTTIEASKLASSVGTCRFKRAHNSSR